MNKIQCPNGHFYDEDEFSECPHCKKLKESKAQRDDPGSGKRWAVEDVPLDQEEKTLVLYAQGVSDSSSEKTVAVFGGRHSAAAQRQGEKLPPTKISPDRDLSREGAPKDPAAPIVEDTERTQVLFSSHSAPSGEQKGSEPKPTEKRPDDPGEAYTDRRNDPTVGWLVCVRGKRFGECFTLGNGKNSIGRTPENRICIAGDTQVSRTQHAFVIFEPRTRKFYLQPGNSSGLTYLNQEIVLLPQPLKERDEIGLNDSRFLFIPLCNDSFSWDECEQ